MNQNKQWVFPNNWRIIFYLTNLWLPPLWIWTRQLLRRWWWVWNSGCCVWCLDRLSQELIQAPSSLNTFFHCFVRSLYKDTIRLFSLFHNIKMHFDIFPFHPNQSFCHILWHTFFYSLFKIFVSHDFLWNCSFPVILFLDFPPESCVMSAMIVSRFPFYLKWKIKKM